MPIDALKKWEWEIAESRGQEARFSPQGAAVWVSENMCACDTICCSVTKSVLMNAGQDSFCMEGWPILCHHPVGGKVAGETELFKCQDLKYFLKYGLTLCEAEARRAREVWWPCDQTKTLQNSVIKVPFPIFSILYDPWDRVTLEWLNKRMRGLFLSPACFIHTAALTACPFESFVFDFT